MGERLRFFLYEREGKRWEAECLLVSNAPS